MAHRPVLVWRHPVSGKVAAKAGAFAVHSGSRLTLLDGTGRIAFSEDMGSPIIGVSLRGGGSLEGHVLAQDGIRRFTRKGALKPTPPPAGATRLLDESDGALLVMTGEGVAVVAKDGRGTAVPIRGAFHAGRLSQTLLLISDRLEMRTLAGEEELSRDGDWVFLLGDEPHAMSDVVVRAEGGALVGSLRRDESWLGGAALVAGWLFWSEEGDSVLVSRSGERSWAGRLPGRVVAADSMGPVVSTPEGIAQYRFVPQGKVLAFEMLCQNPGHCGSFVSLRYRSGCPSCGGEAVLVRHVEADEAATGGPGDEGQNALEGGE